MQMQLYSQFHKKGYFSFYYEKIAFCFGGALLGPKISDSVEKGVDIRLSRNLPTRR